MESEHYDTELGTDMGIEDHNGKRTNNYHADGCKYTLIFLPLRNPHINLPVFLACVDLVKLNYHHPTISPVWLALVRGY